MSTQKGGSGVWILIALMFLAVSLLLVAAGRSVLAVIAFVVVVLVVIAAFLSASSFKASVSYERSEGGDSSTGQSESAASDHEKAQEGLVDLNLKMALAGIPDALRDRTEEIIDKLFDFLPEVNTAYPTSEMAHVTNRISTSYLPQLVNSYCELPEEKRTEEFNQAYTNNLTLIDSELAKMRSLVDSGKVNDFRTETDFVKIRFDAPTLGGGLS